MQYEWITVIGIAFIFLANTFGALLAFFFHDELPKVTQSIFFRFCWRCNVCGVRLVFVDTCY